MTTIPNLNIVIQQGDLVRETQNIRNQALDSAQLSALERLEKEARKKNSVPEMEETEKILLNKDLSNKNNRNSEQPKEKQREKKEQREEKRQSDETGRLLDTIV